MASGAAPGIVLTAGGLVLTADLIAGKWDNKKALRNMTATVLAAFVSAGIDKILPGLGTGFAAVLMVGVIYQRGPEIANKVLGGTT